MTFAPCIACQQPTLLTVEVEHDRGTSLTPMCARCIALGDDLFSVADQASRWSWLPRIGVVSTSSVGLQDANDPTIIDFEGRTLVIEWGRFAVEIFMGRK